MANGTTNIFWKRYWRNNGKGKKNGPFVWIEFEKIKTVKFEKLKEINNDVMTAIDKVNAGRYDLILKKSATLYSKNDITNDVLNRLNGVK